MVIFFYQNSKDLEILQTIEDISKQLRLIRNVNYSIGIAMEVIFHIFPIFTAERGENLNNIIIILSIRMKLLKFNFNLEHSFSVWIPFIDTLKSPAFEIIYTCDVMLSGTGFFAYVPITNLFLSMIVFGVAEIKILCHRLKNLSQKNIGRELEEVKDCIETQKRIMK